MLARTEDVEVTRRHRLQTVQLREELAIGLPDQLLQRVGRARIGGHVLDFGQLRRIAVDRRRGGEHDPANAGVPRRHQDVERRVDVGVVRDPRLGDRQRHRGHSGLVKDDLATGRRGGGRRRIRQVALDELRSGRNVRAQTGAEVVHHPDVVSTVKQCDGQMRPDETSSTGHQNHCHAINLYQTGTPRTAESRPFGRIRGVPPANRGAFPGRCG